MNYKTETTQQAIDRGLTIERIPEVVDMEVINLRPSEGKTCLYDELLEDLGPVVTWS